MKLQELKFEWYFQWNGSLSILKVTEVARAAHSVRRKKKAVRCGQTYIECYTTLLFTS